MWSVLKKHYSNILLFVCLTIFLLGQIVSGAEAAPVSIKALDPYKSAFTISKRASTTLSFQNTGGLPIKFEFNFSGGSAGWNLSLTDMFGAQLKDENSNSRWETSDVPAGQSYTVVVHAFAADPSLSEGSFTAPLLNVYQFGELNPSTTSQLQFAIPSSFVYAMADSAYLMRLAYLSPNAKMEATELLTTGGINLAVSAALLNKSRYILAWENQLDTAIDSRNVEFSIFSNVGGALVNRAKPFDNSGTNNSGTGILDTVPVLASSASGNFGLMFLRASSQDPTPTQVMFQLFTQDGIKIGSNLVLASNVEVSTPQLVPIIDNSQNPTYQLIAAWEDGTGKIQASRIDAQTGAFIETKTIKDTGNIVDSKLPLLAPLSDSRTFIAYSSSAKTLILHDMSSSLVLDPSPGITITNTIAKSRDAVQFLNNNILFAWVEEDPIDPKLNYLKYTIVNSSVNQQVIDPQILDLPKNLQPANISVDLNRQGQAMIFWWSTDPISIPLDERKDYLNYALVSDNGSLITPPMIFRDSGFRNNLNVNPNGQGIVGLDGLYAQFLPNIAR